MDIFKKLIEFARDQMCSKEIKDYVLKNINKIASKINLEFD